MAALLLLCAVTRCGAAAPPPENAVAQDTMAQRTLACTACHGAQGRAGPDGYYPRLAGKPAGYLYHQLLNFSQGRRHYALMTGLLDNLNDAYLREIADYFSALDLPYPPPHAANIGDADLARGAQLVHDGDPALGLPACSQCHGKSLTGTLPYIPGLLGLPGDYINAQLGGWRTGQRQATQPDCMAKIARTLKEGDVNALARWLSAQPVPGDSHPSAQAPVQSTLLKEYRCGSAP